MSTSLDRLARDLADLQRQVRGQSQPQLGSSSFEEGAIQQYDPANPGQVVQRVGQQWDGTFVPAALSGPVPPAPTPPIVTSTYGGLIVRWDGLWALGAFTPMDLAVVEVHASTEAGYDPLTADTLRTVFATPRGGETFIALPDGVWHVALVAKTLAGKRSLSSEQVAGSPASFGDLGGSTIFFGPDEPTTGQAGDLWLREPDHVAHRLVEGVWEPAQDQGIVQALQDAQNAQLTADAKGRIFVQASAPTGLTAEDDGDLWLDSDDGNRPWTWSGTAWTDRRLGNSAIQPNSLVARDVVATGTVSAALLEAVMVLANRIIAGTPGAARVELGKFTATEHGFRLYAADGVTVLVDIGVASDGSVRAVFKGLLEAAEYRSKPVGQPQVRIGPSVYRGNDPAVHFDTVGAEAVDIYQPNIRWDSVLKSLVISGRRATVPEISQSFLYLDERAASLHAGPVSSARVSLNGSNGEVDVGGVLTARGSHATPHVHSGKQAIGSASVPHGLSGITRSRTTAQTVSPSVWTTIVFDGLWYHHADDGSLNAAGMESAWTTLPTVGWWLISCTAGLTGSADNFLRIVDISGNTLGGSSARLPWQTSTTTVLIYNTEPGLHVAAQIYNTAASTLNTHVDGPSTPMRFSAIRVH